MNAGLILAVKYNRTPFFADYFVKFIASNFAPRHCSELGRGFHNGAEFMAT